MPDVAVGQQAPDFTLRDQNLQEVKLSSLSGSPVVLVFYPADFSPLCTNELRAIRDDFSSFEQKGAKVYGISKDSPWAHRAFIEKEGLKHPLLSDPKGEAAQFCGAWNDQFSIAERMTVVLDKGGVIRYVVHNNAATARDHTVAVVALG